MSTHAFADFSIPVQHAPRPTSFDVRPKALEDWISALPLADVLATARLLTSAFAEINQLRLPPVQRFKALERLREPARYASETLNRSLIGLNFPLSERSRKVTNQVRELQHTMAVGYAIIVVELAGLNAAQLDTRLLVTAMHRTLRHLDGVLLRAYQVYDPTPAGLWRDIHRIFRFAHEHDLDSIPVMDPEYQEARTSTVRDAYKQILLLATCSPYRLRQGEVQSVHVALESWAPAAELYSANRAQGSGSLFIVDTDADAPPVYRTLHRAPLTEHCYAFDTTRLTRLLRDKLARLPQRAVPSEWEPVRMNQDLLARIMPAWGVLAKRGFSRLEHTAPVEICVGLKNIHALLATPGIPSAASDDDPVRFQAAPLSSERGQTPEVWEMARPTPGAVRAAGGDLWVMKNLSAGGCCLLWNQAVPTQVRVGELVALREQSQSAPRVWTVGVIRWLRQDGERQLEIGVQLLAPAARAVRVHTLAGPRSSAYRALWLSGLPNKNQPSTLILPSLAEAIGPEIILETGERSRKIRLTRPLEDTGAFAQFECTGNS